MRSSDWGFFNPLKINFGRGCRARLIYEFKGRRCLVVSSPRGRHQLESDMVLSAAINNADNCIWVDEIKPNPSLSCLQKYIDDLKGKSINCILALGGGSSIDSGKILAFGLSPLVDSTDIHNLIGLARNLPYGSSLPLYALPTTAGTGSEVTPFATIWDYAERKKLSLSGNPIYPYAAYIDPELMDTLPLDSTMYSGLDAINQAAESIWSKVMTPITEALSHRSLVLGFNALPELLENPRNFDMRDAMAEASLMAGLSISQTRTSLCHAISYPLTAHFGIPHGLACAFTMPAVLKRNIKESNDGRFKRLAMELISEKADTSDLLKKFDQFNIQLKIASQIRQSIGSLEALFELSDQMFSPGRSDNTLIKVDEKMIREILRESWAS
jgi:phosphonate metabolism-associated iron-containing alcohol dehydrogenase